MTENYYQILGLDNFASTSEIKQAYRRLAKKYHPDKSGGSDEIFKRVSTAYQKLMDPSTKANLDEWLRAPIPEPTNTSSYRPKYKERTSYYTSEKVHYTPTVKMYGTLFLIGFVMIAILGPIGVMYKASNFHYKEGLEFKKSGEYGRALMSFKEAISWFGQRSGSSSVEAARIGLDYLKSNDQANYFIEVGFEYASSPIIIGELHFLKGRVLQNKNEPDEALKELSQASQFNYNADSIALYKGIVNAFYLENFEQGLNQFDKIISHNRNDAEALFGKAWCLQKMNRPIQSLEVYNQLLKLNENHILGNFYRGHNNIVVGDTLQACADFKKAMELGYQPALIYYTNQCGDYLR